MRAGAGFVFSPSADIDGIGPDRVKHHAIKERAPMADVKRAMTV